MIRLPFVPHTPASGLRDRQPSAALIVYLSALFLLAGCGDDAPSTPDETDVVDAFGDTIEGDVDGTDANADDATEADADDTGADVVTEPDADADVSTEDTTADAGEDASISADAISDYIRCETRTDCPIGGGDCVTEIAINRSNGGGDTVSVAEAFGDPTLVGVCGRDCTTTGQTACDDLVIEDSRGRDTSFTCQLVWADESPYPSDTPLPFDDTLDTVEMELGVLFAAVCRPPFELHADVDGRFCGDCTDDGDCGSGVCWSMLEGVSGGPGLCVTGCGSDDSCSLGFSCDELEDAVGGIAGNFCVPEMATCGVCADRDGDCFGVGRCGSDSRRDRTCVGDEPVSQVDCDDRNANAYFDSTDIEHPFPDFCGEIDNNCNGASDAVEQIGTEAYGFAHCTECGDVCEGVIVDGDASRGCALRDSAMACVAICDSEGVADCDGDIENGCETVVTDPSRLYYRDADEDGRGDSSDVLFDCGDSGAPDGYVAIGGDCLDDPAAPGAAITYGSFERDGTDYEAAAEICDGVDNNCLDDGDLDAIDAGTACAESDAGVCAEACVDGALTCAPASGDVIEICDGLDNDCDGFVDGDDESVFIPAETPLDGTCAAPESLGVCTAGSWTCTASGVACESSVTPSFDRPDGDRIDLDCDGIDGDLDNAIYVRAGGVAVETVCPTACTSGAGCSCHGGFRAMSDLSAAVALAGREGRDVYVSEGTYYLAAAVDLPDGVGVYGGFEWDADTGLWARPNAGSAPAQGSRSRVVRDRNLSDPVVSAFTGSDLLGGAGLRTVLGFLEIEVLDAAGSSVDVVVVDCVRCEQLTLDDVVIIAGAGSDGLDGAPGSSGANGGNGRAFLGGSSSCGAAGGGLPGLSGSPAGLGGDTSEPGTAGAAPTVAGTGGSLPGMDGTSGVSGSTGGGGGGGACYARFDVGVISLVLDACDGATFDGGLLIDWTGSASGGGAGGCGATGGDGGQAGGDSIGLRLQASGGARIAGTIRRADAGAGGDGGSGGPGGAGGDTVASTYNLFARPFDIPLEYVGAFIPAGSGAGGGGGGGGGAGAGGVSACLRVDRETGIDSSLMTCHYRSADGSITATPTEFDGLAEAGEVGTTGAAGVGGYWHVERARVNPGPAGLAAVDNACGGFAGAIVTDFVSCPDAP